MTNDNTSVIIEVPLTARHEQLFAAAARVLGITVEEFVRESAVNQALR